LEGGAGVQIGNWGRRGFRDVGGKRGKRKERGAQ